MVGAAVGGSANFQLSVIGQKGGEQKLVLGVVESTLPFGLGIGSLATEALHLAMCAARSP